jgi:hypothetical protein
MIFVDNYNYVLLRSKDIVKIYSLPHLKKLHEKTFISLKSITPLKYRVTMFLFHFWDNKFKFIKMRTQNGITF